MISNRGDARSSSGARSRTSLLKVDIHRRREILRNAEPCGLPCPSLLLAVMVFPMAWRWKLLLRARGVSEGIPWLTRAYFVWLRGGASTANLRRRGRIAHLETRPAPPGAGVTGRRLGPARARHWRRSNAAARCDRPSPRDRPLFDWRLRVDRAVARARDDRSRGCLLLTSGRVRLVLPPTRPEAAARAAGASRVRGRPRLPRAPTARWVRSLSPRSSSRSAASSRCTRPGAPSASTCRCCVSRTWAAALPRDARAFHDQRARRT